MKRRATRLWMSGARVPDEHPARSGGERFELSDDVTAVNGFRDCPVGAANPLVGRSELVEGKP